MIITNNEEILRAPCVDVTLDEVPALVQALEAELENSGRLGRPGIGLAAPQIGIHKNIAIVRLGQSGTHDLTLNLVNARITKGYDQQIFRSEGCLSFPGRVEDTMRYQELYVTNNLIPPYNFVVTGLMAVVVQHELDHVNGVLLPDRALIKNSGVKLGPNEPCFCGSNRKFKKCCGK